VFVEQASAADRSEASSSMSTSFRLKQVTALYPKLQNKHRRLAPEICGLNAESAFVSDGGDDDAGGVAAGAGDQASQAETGRK